MRVIAAMVPMTIRLQTSPHSRVSVPCSSQITPRSKRQDAHATRFIAIPLKLAGQAQRRLSSQLLPADPPTTPLTAQVILEDVRDSGGYFRVLLRSRQAASMWCSFEFL